MSREISEIFRRFLPAFISVVILDSYDARNFRCVEVCLIRRYGRCSSLVNLRRATLSLCPVTDESLSPSAQISSFSCRKGAGIVHYITETQIEI